jgi:hypothetical protein
MAVVGNLEKTGHRIGETVEQVIDETHAQAVHAETTTGLDHRKLVMWVFIASETIFFAALMGASLVVPYVTTTEPGKWFSGFGGGSKTTPDPTTASGGVTANPAMASLPPGARGPAQPLHRIEGPPVTDLGEVIRFDATPNWVISRWSRVSTAAAGPDLQGYRVALVTGTREDDIAGALTYYFNRQQRVQRITFQGTTGDARRLVGLVMSRYGFEPQQSDPSVYLYQVRWNGRPLSELQVRPARVVTAGAAHSRYDVALEINNQAR